MDTCSTKNSGVFHVDFFMWIIGVDLHVEPYFYSTCNPRCISHGDYLCTFSGVFNMNCITWINGVPVHMDIRWISCEECHLIFFSHFFHMYFSHRLLVYLSTCLFSGYQVKFEPYFFHM